MGPRRCTQLVSVLTLWTCALGVRGPVPVAADEPPPAPHAEAVRWGPIPLVAGWLGDLVGDVPGGTSSRAVGTVTAGGARRWTWVYAIDLGSGTWLGQVERAASVHGVSILGSRAWVHESAGTSQVVALDLEAGLAERAAHLLGRRPHADGSATTGHVTGTFHHRVEHAPRAAGFPDKWTFTDLRSLAQFELPTVQLYGGLAPDVLLGAFRVPASGAFCLYDLRTRSVIGTRTPGYGGELRGWDPDRKVAFTTHLTSAAPPVTAELRVEDATTGRVVARTPLPAGLRTVHPLPRPGTNALDARIDAGWIAPATLDLGGHRYLLDTGSETLLFDVDEGGGTLVGRFPRLHAELVPGPRLPFRGPKLTTGVLAVDEARIDWQAAIPRGGPGPFRTSRGLVYVLPSRRRTEGDLLYGRDEATGAVTWYTEFEGRDLEVLSAQPLVVAMRASYTPRERAPWSLVGYDADRLPTTPPTPAVTVGFTDLSRASAIADRFGPAPAVAAELAAFTGEHRYAGTSVPVTVKLKESFAELLGGREVVLTVTAGELAASRWTLDGDGTFETSWRLPLEPGPQTLSASVEGAHVEVAVEVEPVEPLVVDPVHGPSGPPARAWIANLMPDPVTDLTLSIEVHRFTVTTAWERPVAGPAMAAGLAGLAVAPGQCVPLRYDLTPTEALVAARTAVLKATYRYQGKAFERSWDLLVHGAPRFDVDGDGIADDLDLSPGVVPSEPPWSTTLRAGQQRATARLFAHGLAGWVEVYDYAQLSGRCVLDWTDKDDPLASRENTRASRLSPDGIRAAYADAYEGSTIASIARAPGDPHEKGADQVPESTWGMGQCDFVHPTRYLFNYDVVVEAYDVETKSTEGAPAPTGTGSTPFSSAFVPVRVRGGVDQSVVVQLRTHVVPPSRPGDYELPAFAYRWYRSPNLDADTNLPIRAEDLAVGLARDDDLFDVELRLRASDVASDGTVWLLVTPLRLAEVGGRRRTEALAPTSFRTTGVQRTLELAGGEGTLAWDTAGLASLDGPLPNTPGSGPGTEQLTFETGMMRAVEGTAGATAYEVSTLERLMKVAEFGVGLGKAGASYVSAVKDSVKDSLGIVDKPDAVPDQGVWKAPKKADLFGTALVGVKVGAILATDGKSAWTAFQEGDETKGTLYVLRTGVGLTEQWGKLTEVRFVKVGLGGTSRAAKFGKVLGSKGGQAGIAAAMGAIDITLLAVELARTEDPIKRRACGEKIASTAIETGVAVVGAFFPPVAAADAAMQIEVLVVRQFMDNEMAKKIATSYGRVLTFTAQYFWGSVPSEYAEEAYQKAWARANDTVTLRREEQRLAVFVEPKEGEAPVEDTGPLAEVAAAWARDVSGERSGVRTQATLVGTTSATDAKGVIVYEIVRRRPVDDTNDLVTTDRVEVTFQNFGTVAHPRWALAVQRLLSRTTAQVPRP